MKEQLDKLYGGRVRVRACGLCWIDGKLLLVNHQGITEGDFWAPPGGGVEFGDSVEDTLVKEFKEETGATIQPLDFRFVYEFIQGSIHSIELFHNVEYLSGRLRVGFDPESPSHDQILTATRLMSFGEIMAIPAHERHGIFSIHSTENALKTAFGHWKT